MFIVRKVVDISRSTWWYAQFTIAGLTLLGPLKDKENIFKIITMLFTSKGITYKLEWTVSNFTISVYHETETLAHFKVMKLGHQSTKLN